MIAHRPQAGNARPIDPGVTRRRSPSGRAPAPSGRASPARSAAAARTAQPSRTAARSARSARRSSPATEGAVRHPRNRPFSLGSRPPRYSLDRAIPRSSRHLGPEDRYVMHPPACAPTTSRKSREGPRPAILRCAGGVGALRSRCSQSRVPFHIATASDSRYWAAGAEPRRAQRCRRRYPARRPPPVQPPSCHTRRSRRSGGPVAFAESLERLSPTSARVSARPVIGRRQPAVTGLPGAHRVEHPLARPARARSRPGWHALQYAYASPLPFARLRVGAAAAAHALVAGLDRPRLLPGRVVEVRLDRRRRAAQAVGDLPDREALELAVMPRQGDRPATLENPTRSRELTPCPSHRVTLPRSIGVSVEVGTQVPTHRLASCIWRWLSRNRGSVGWVEFEFWDASEFHWL